MSSRILRGDSPIGARPVAWRAFGQLGSLATPGSEQLADRPDTPVRETEREMHARIEQARQAGFAQAQSMAAEDAAARLEPVLKRFARMTEELAGMRRRFRAEAEEDTVKLSIAIARRILHRELSSDPEALLGLVKAAFAKVDARETHRLRVSTEDAGILERYRSKLDLPERMEIVADPGLECGSAVFETTRGSLDASVSAQLAEIERGFADFVRMGR